MPLWRALVVSLAILSGLGAYAAVAPWVTLARLVPLERPPAVLADRAEQVLASFGFNEPRGDTAEGFLTSIDYVTWIGQTIKVRSAGSECQQVSRPSTTGIGPARTIWCRGNLRCAPRRPTRRQRMPACTRSCSTRGAGCCASRRHRRFSIPTLPPNPSRRRGRSSSRPRASTWPRFRRRAAMEPTRLCRRAWGVGGAVPRRRLEGAR